MSWAVKLLVCGLWLWVELSYGDKWTDESKVNDGLEMAGMDE